MRRVDSEWIAAKKDWQEAKKRYKMQEKVRSSVGGDSRKSSSRADSPQPGVQEDTVPCYQPEMDEMRCILYTHGGENSPYICGPGRGVNTPLTSFRWLLLWEHRSRKIRNPAVCTEDQWSRIRYRE